MLLFIAVFIFIIFAPQMWVSYVLKKNHKPIESLDGTGGELALHLIERFKLDGVKVMRGEKNNDHYNPQEKIVCLSPEVYDGKSLSAVAVAAHEVGHAMQFCRNEPVSKLREKYLYKAHKIQQYGVYMMMIAPFVGLAFRVPHFSLLTLLIGIITMAASVLMYVAILPEEYDASFKKALPILAEGYITKEQLPVVRQILKACALTYVAGSLADILRLWRWIMLIR
ncbi:MAG: zinc metallopeptidase [Alcanivoracaceae bacterium]|nr:zinc metallopeptidase [Alcanivoracaceae bacterium]